MAKTFVAINDSVHRLIRRIARQTPLCTGVSAKGAPLIAYDVEEQDLPEDYFSLAMLHSIGGMPVSSLALTNWKPRNEDRLGIAEQVHFFDAVKLDRRCCRDLRLKTTLRGAGMLSCELLAYGSGMLRAANDDPQDELHRYIRQQHGRAESKHECVYARILALHRVTRTSCPTLAKESYESTNLVYGDVLGELEQLWERRTDIAFMEAVARSLADLRTGGHIAAYLNPPQNMRQIVHFHLRAQALWNRPPASARALIRRLDYLLSNICVDSKRPESASSRSKPGPFKDKPPSKSPRAGWDDASGYDGWLNPPG